MESAIDKNIRGGGITKLYRRYKENGKECSSVFETIWISVLLRYFIHTVVERESNLFHYVSGKGVRGENRRTREDL